MAHIGGGGATSTIQNVTLTGDTSFGGVARFNVSGGTLNLGGFKLTKVGVNQIALTGGTVTDGDIDVNAGNLSFEAGVNVKGTGTVSVNPGAVLGLWSNVANADQAWHERRHYPQLGSGNGNSTFSSPITLETTTVVDVLNRGGATPATTNLVLGGGITESGGSYGLTKVGPGTLTLSGVNDFTGALNVTAGTAVLPAAQLSLRARSTSPLALSLMFHLPASLYSIQARCSPPVAQALREMTLSAASPPLLARRSTSGDQAWREP